MYIKLHFLNLYLAMAIGSVTFLWHRIQDRIIVKADQSDGKKMKRNPPTGNRTETLEAFRK